MPHDFIADEFEACEQYNSSLKSIPALRSHRNPIVTDHALIRWLERVHGIPMEAFRSILNQIVSDGLDTKASSLIKEGYVYILRGCEDGKHRLITIRPRKNRGKK